MSRVNRILSIDSSARKSGSVSRSLAEETINHLSQIGAVSVTRRDVSGGLPLVDADWVSANFTPVDARTDDQKTKLAPSASLVDELKNSDTLIISLPIYNFGIPASLKAWIDMICRAGMTFRYTENGPEGLVKAKRAIILLASGGTAMDSPMDFASPYLRHVLAFIGITDVTFIAADALAINADEKRMKASAKIKELTI